MGPAVVISAVLLGAGCFFILVAAIGLVRFPDFYSRMHPAGKTDSLGQVLTLSGLMVYEGLTMVSLKLFIIICFMLIANPTATHAIANAAHTIGLRPWEKGEQRR